VKGGGSIAPAVDMDVEMVGETGAEPEVGALPFDFGVAGIEIDTDPDPTLALAVGSTSFALPFALAVAAAFSARSFLALSIFMLFR
jgi:hypothetical protein